MDAPFGEWLPDLGEDTRGASEAKNVVSLADFYVPFLEFVRLFSALPSRPLGAETFRGLNRVAETIIGTATHLYRGDVTGTGFSWEEIASGYNTDIDEFDHWEMDQWQNRVFLTNFERSLQQYTLGSGGPVTDLIATIQAKRLAVARDFVLIGDVIDEFGANPTRVRWCAYRNPDDWVPNIDTQAGFKDLEGGGGQIQRIIGGEVPLIFREAAVHRFTYEGVPNVWQNDRFLEGLGTPAPRSVVKSREDVYFLADSGFMKLEGGVRPVPIGENKVDSTFRRLVNQEFLSTVQASFLPRTKVVIWSFSTTPNELPDTHFIFNTVTGRWTYVEAELELFSIGSSPAYTLEDLDNVGDLDSLPVSLDSRAWLGDIGLVLAFNRQWEAGRVEGPPMRALLSTGEYSPHNGWRFSPQNLRPIIHSTCACVDMLV